MCLNDIPDRKSKKSRWVVIAPCVTRWGERTADIYVFDIYRPSFFPSMRPSHLVTGFYLNMMEPLHQVLMLKKSPFSRNLLTHSYQKIYIKEYFHYMYASVEALPGPIKVRKCGIPSHRRNRPGDHDGRRSLSLPLVRSVCPCPIVIVGEKTRSDLIDSILHPPRRNIFR